MPERPEPTRDQLAKDYAMALAIIDRLTTSRAELLAALTEGVRVYEHYGLIAAPIEGESMPAGRWINQARAAIAKAEGEPT